MRNCSNKTKEYILFKKNTLRSLNTWVWHPIIQIGTNFAFTPSDLLIFVHRAIRKFLTQSRFWEKSLVDIPLWYHTQIGNLNLISNPTCIFYRNFPKHKKGFICSYCL